MSGDLCRRCALCCDGTLFAYVRLEDEEARKLEERGTELARADSHPVLPQACVHLVGTRCDIYADRPRSCARFECDMLRAHRRGELTREECLVRIADVRRFPLHTSAAVEASPSQFLALSGLRDRIHGGSSTTCVSRSTGDVGG